MSRVISGIGIIGGSMTEALTKSEEEQTDEIVTTTPMGNDANQDRPIRSLTAHEIDELGDRFAVIVKDRIGLMPALFNPKTPPFKNNLDLYVSYYLESYYCLALGQNHAGIVALGQLLEFTLRRILFVHTGRDNWGSGFQALIMRARGMKRNRGNEWVKKYDRVVAEAMCKELENLKTHIRNPYTHGDYKGVFHGDGRIPVYGVRQGSDRATTISRYEQAQDLYRAGVLKPVEFDVTLDPAVASQVKQDLDAIRGPRLALRVYADFWILLEDYLRPEDYARYREEFGTPYDAIPMTDLLGDPAVEPDAE